MKIALEQMEMACDMERNYQKSIRFIQKAARQGADLICFPEVQLTPFFPQYEKRDAAEYLLGLDSSYIRGICDVCKDCHIHASPNFYVKENGRHYDMSLLIDDGGKIIGRQKMVHIAQCERFYEQDYYEPSEEGFEVFETKFGKVGIVVCFDRHYPESIRTLALRGAQLIIVPTANTSDEPSELFQWEIKVQAFQNSVNVAMCNRVGVEDQMNFCGESLIADYSGSTLALGDSSETLLLADIDMPGALAARERKPYTNLRRTELYE